MSIQAGFLDLESLSLGQTAAVTQVQGVGAFRFLTSAMQRSGGTLCQTESINMQMMCFICSAYTL